MGQWRQAKTGPQQHPRIATSVPVRIATVDPETDPDTGKLFFRSSEATTANLSRGGAYVHSWEPLAAGRRVIVVLDVPSSSAGLQLVGRVAWTRRELVPNDPSALGGPGYGVEFVGGTASELAALDRYLSGLQARPESRRTKPENVFPTAQP